jgi:hypothetical protein
MVAWYLEANHRPRLPVSANVQRFHCRHANRQQRRARLLLHWRPRPLPADAHRLQGLIVVPGLSQIFCIVTVTVATNPVVRLYETQKPRLS